MGLGLSDLFDRGVELAGRTVVASNRLLEVPLRLGPTDGGVRHGEKDLVGPGERARKSGGPFRKLEDSPAGEPELPLDLLGLAELGAESLAAPPSGLGLLPKPLDPSVEPLDLELGGADPFARFLECPRLRDERDGPLVRDPAGQAALLELIGEAGEVGVGPLERRAPHLPDRLGLSPAVVSPLVALSGGPFRGERLPTRHRRGVVRTGPCEGPVDLAPVGLERLSRDGLPAGRADPLVDERRRVREGELEVAGLACEALPLGRRLGQFLLDRRDGPWGRHGRGVRRTGGVHLLEASGGLRPFGPTPLERPLGLGFAFGGGAPFGFGHVEFASAVLGSFDLDGQSAASIGELFRASEQLGQPGGQRLVRGRLRPQGRGPAFGLGARYFPVRDRCPVRRETTFELLELPPVALEPSPPIFGLGAFRLGLLGRNPPELDRTMRLLARGLGRVPGGAAAVEVGLPVREKLGLGGPLRRLALEVAGDRLGVLGGGAILLEPEGLADRFETGLGVVGLQDLAHPLLGDVDGPAPQVGMGPGVRVVREPQ